MSIIGHIDGISHRSVVGWVADRQAPARALTVVASVDGVERGRAVADRHRDKLAAHVGGDSTGHHEFRINFEPPLSVFKPHEVDIRIVDFPAARLANTPRTLPAPAPAPWRLTPLVVTSLGRSGTTLLMSEFVRNPAIVVPDRYPYEIKLIAYYASAFRALASNEDRARSTNPDALFTREQQFRIGHNPYYNSGHYHLIDKSEKLREYFEAEIPGRLAELFRGNIARFYDLVAEDQGKPQARYFAEKGDLDEAAREGARMLFGPVKEIVLARDPRDLLCSARAFWKMTVPQAMAMLATSLPRLEQIRHEQGVFVLRYEDLIADAAASRAALGRYLDIEMMPPVEADQKAWTRHATSATPQASLNRWREDLSAAEISDCEARFASYMAAFDYQALPKAAAPPGIAATQQPRAAGGSMEMFLDGALATGAHRVVDVDCRSSEARPLLVAGWSAIETNGVWSAAASAVLRVALPENFERGTLVLLGHPFTAGAALPRQRLRMSVDGVDRGEVELAAFGRIECAVTRNGNVLDVQLAFPDAQRPKDVKGGARDDRLLGFCLERVAVVVGGSGGAAEPENADAAPSGSLPDRELMLKFVSLGENCEFGLVQRKCGAEPPDLLRFSSTPLPRLLRALRARFNGVARPENLVVELSRDGREYMVLDRDYGFYHHAWVLAGAEPPAQILKRETGRLPLLIDGLIRDLTLARRIFVYHSQKPLDLGLVTELVRALHAYGPATLLWMERAEPGHPSGSVERLGPNLLKGHLDHYAPADNAPRFELAGWLSVCRAAYAAWAAPAVAPAVDLAS